MLAHLLSFKTTEEIQFILSCFRRKHFCGLYNVGLARIVVLAGGYNSGGDKRISSRLLDLDTLTWSDGPDLPERMVSASTLPTGKQSYLGIYWTNGHTKYGSKFEARSHSILVQTFRFPAEFLFPGFGIEKSRSRESRESRDFCHIFKFTDMQWSCSSPERG